MVETKSKKYILVFLALVCSLCIWAGINFMPQRQASAISKANVVAMGVDISQYQGNVNFDTLASKANYAILRIGYGGSAPALDRMFDSYLSAALARNMNIGIYIYSYADSTTEATNEANWVVTQLNSRGLNQQKLTYPVYFDYEESTIDTRSRASNTAIVNAFVNTIRNAGYYPGLYMGGSKMNNYINLNDINCDIWVAAYGPGWTGFTNNYYNSKVKMWQFNTGAYSDGTGDAKLGSYYGVSSTYIDQNYCFIDYPTTIRSSGLNGFSGSASGGTTTTLTSKGFGYTISEADGDINFTTMASTDFQFAFARLGNSTTQTEDSKFARNMNGLLSIGRYRGVYVESSATTTDGATAEANWVYETLQKYGVGQVDFPILYSYSFAVTDKASVTAIVNAFQKGLESKNAVSMLFCNGNQLLNSVDTSSLTVDVYLAWYKSSSVTLNDLENSSYYYYGVTMWQYSNGESSWGCKYTGAQAGSSATTISHNHALIDYPSMIKERGLNNFKIWSAINGTYSIAEQNCHIDENGNNGAAGTSGHDVPYYLIDNKYSHLSAQSTTATFFNTYPAETYQYGSVKFGYCPLYIDSNNWILVYCAWEHDDVQTTKNERMKSVVLTGKINGTRLKFDDNGQYNASGAWSECTRWVHDNGSMTALQTVSTLASGYKIDTVVTSTNIKITVNGVQTHNVNLDLSSFVGNVNSKMALFAFWADLTVTDVAITPYGAYDEQNNWIYLDSTKTATILNTSTFNETDSRSLYLVANEYVWADGYEISAHFSGKTFNGYERFGIVPYYVDDNNYLVVFMNWNKQTKNPTRMEKVTIYGLVNGDCLQFSPIIADDKYYEVWVHDVEEWPAQDQNLIALQTAPNLSTGYDVVCTITNTNYLTIKINNVSVFGMSITDFPLVGTTANSNAKAGLFASNSTVDVTNFAIAEVANASSAAPINNFTITFNANGGTGLMSSLTATVGQTQKLTKNAFTRSGYVFKGWSTIKANADAGIVEYTDEQGVVIMASANTTVTLYAVWQSAATAYSINFNANGGSGTMGTLTAVVGQAQKLTKNEFTRAGYEFIGWSTTAGGTVAYAEQASVTDLAVGGESVTLYAVWQSVCGWKNNLDGSYSIENGLVDYNTPGGFYLISNTQVQKQSYTVSAHFSGKTQKDLEKYGLVVYYLDKDNYLVVTLNWNKNSSQDRHPFMADVIICGKVNGGYLQFHEYVADDGLYEIWVHDVDKYPDQDQNLIALQKASNFADGFDIVCEISNLNNLRVTVNGVLVYNGVMTDFANMVGASASNDTKIGLFAYESTVDVTEFKVTGVGGESSDGSADSENGSGGNDKTYTINFHENGGTGTMQSLTVDVGKSQTLNKNLFTREGYRFLGWAKTQEKANEGRVDYGDEVNVIDLTDADGNITLYAVWAEDASAGGSTTKDGGGSCSCSGSLETSMAVFALAGVVGAVLLCKKLVKKEN